VTFTVEIDREHDGRWLAEDPAPGCHGLRPRPREAVARVQALAFRVITDASSVAKRRAA
jgi:hypothetical protein